MLNLRNFVRSRGLWMRHSQVMRAVDRACANRPFWRCARVLG